MQGLRPAINHPEKGRGGETIKSAFYVSNFYDGYVFLTHARRARPCLGQFVTVPGRLDQVVHQAAD